MPNKSFTALFIGAPSTGKTSVLNHLKAKGLLCFEEISRQVTKEARIAGINHLFKNNPLLFSEKLLEGRIKQFLNAQNNINHPSFIDRGLPDITAYLDMVNVSYPEKFKEANYLYRYNIVFWFPVWKSIYITDFERYENIEMAQNIEKYLLKSYQSLDYNLIEVPKLSVEKRVEFILSHIDFK